MPKLFIHIGASKCASTSIQTFIFENAKKLNDRGLLVADQNLLFGSRGDNPIWFFQTLIDRGETGEAVSRAMGVLGDRDGVISAENLSNPIAANLFSEVAKRFDIHLLHVIRRQDEWLYSSWKQWHSKAGHSLEDYIDYALRIGEPGFAKTVHAWSPIAKTIHTVSLDVIDSLEVEIMRWLGLVDDGTFRRLPSKANPTFDFRIVDLLSRHSAAYDHAHDTKIDDFVVKYSKLAGSVKFHLPKDISSKIMAHFHDENVALLGASATNIIERNSFSEKIPIGGISETSEHDFIIACLLESMGRMSAEMEAIKADLNYMYRASNGPAPPPPAPSRERRRWDWRRYLRYS
ncbi:MAG: hypothetical protein E5X77_06690 [Mesorhizobium sp.]|nr:MAG: hypothetical protein E5X77_06690 [Mesorhizobium sp.]